MSSTAQQEPIWTKSSYSSGGGACIQVADLGNLIGVRDSKDPDGPALTFPRDAFAAFVAAVRNGEFTGQITA